MKPNIHVIPARWLSLLALSGLFVAPVQRSFAQSDQDLIEVARSVVATDRKAVVVAAMEFTEAESQAFWPLYRDYRSAMDRIIDDRVNLVLKYSKLYPNVPEEQAKEMLDTYTGLEKRQVDERNVYLKKFTNVLPAAKALRFAQVETRLDLIVHLNLAARIPLVPVAAAN